MHPTQRSLWVEETWTHFRTGRKRKRGNLGDMHLTLWFCQWYQLWRWKLGENWGWSSKKHVWVWLTWVWILVLPFTRTWRAPLVAQLVKNPPVMRETWVWSLSWEDPLEKGKATLQYSGLENSMECIRVGHNWVTFTFNSGPWNSSKLLTFFQKLRTISVYPLRLLGGQLGNQHGRLITALASSIWILFCPPPTFTSLAKHWGLRGDSTQPEEPWSGWWLNGYICLGY